MMKTSIYACLVAAAALLSPTSTIAQDGPTYDETLSFLQEKTNFQLGSGNWVLTEIVRCELKYENTNLDGSSFHSEVSLPSLDPSTVEADKSGISANLRQGEARVALFESTAEGEVQSDGTADIFWLHTFNPQTNAPKVKSALKHLIELCGGKGELF